MFLLEKDADLMPMLIDLECNNIIKSHSLLIKREQLVVAYKVIRDYLLKNHINYKSPQFNYDRFLASLLHVNKDFYTAVMLAIFAGNFHPSKLQNLRTSRESNTHEIGYYCEDVQKISLVYCKLLSYAEFDCNNLLLPDAAKERIELFRDCKYHSNVEKNKNQSVINGGQWKIAFPSNNYNN